MSDERETLIREFPVEFAEGDGRTIEARIVPYNKPTRVVDLPEHGGTGVPYEETWLPGAFENQTRAVGRIKVFLNFEHESGLRGIIGHGAALEDRQDALYGTFRVHENADGDKALQLVREGLLGGISLEAVPLRTVRKNGVVERVRAHLDKVALCREPAYEGAEVLAVREAPDPDPDPDPDPAPPDPGPEPPENSELEETLQRIGYEPLLARAVVRRPWDGAASRFTDEEYERSCLICRGGDEPPKTRCSLPVLEPNGDVNANALGAAAAALAGARSGLRSVTPELKATAARKLIRYYRQAEMEPPQNLRALASR